MFVPRECKKTEHHQQTLQPTRNSPPVHPSPDPKTTRSNTSDNLTQLHTQDNPSQSHTSVDYPQPNAEQTSNTTTSTNKMQLGADVISTQPWTGKPFTITQVKSSTKSTSSSNQKSTIERAMNKAKSKFGRRPSDSESIASTETKYYGKMSSSGSSMGSRPGSL